MMNKKIIGLIFSVFILCRAGIDGPHVKAEKLPRPTFDNTVIFSFYYDMVNQPGSETDYLKRQFGNGLDHIGDAVLIEGARPDVESAYPSYPYNYKAGWGYMLLTNFLPNQGNGAVGYFYLDTTAYANGVHTIQWTAVDNAGNKDGIGSRYFTIQNSGENSRLAVLGVRFSVLSEISGIPVDYSAPVRFRKGYNNHIKSQMMYPDNRGRISIEIKELERIVIQLSDGNFKKDLESFTSLHLTPNTKHLTPKNASSARYSGYMAVEGYLRPLPIGSTLDRKRGVFYWQPGPGFIGEYRLVFVSRDKAGKFKKRNVTIKIVPKFSK